MKKIWLFLFVLLLDGCATAPGGLEEKLQGASEVQFLQPCTLGSCSAPHPGDPALAGMTATWVKAQVAVKILADILSCRNWGNWEVFGPSGGQGYFYFPRPGLTGRVVWYGPRQLQAGDQLLIRSRGGDVAYALNGEIVPILAGDIWSALGRAPGLRTDQIEKIWQPKDWEAQRKALRSDFPHTYVREFRISAFPKADFNRYERLEGPWAAMGLGHPLAMGGSIANGLAGEIWKAVNENWDDASQIPACVLQALLGETEPLKKSGISPASAAGLYRVRMGRILTHQTLPSRGERRKL